MLFKKVFKTDMSHKQSLKCFFQLFFVGMEGILIVVGYQSVQPSHFSGISLNRTTVTHINSIIGLNLPRNIDICIF